MRRLVPCLVAACLGLCAPAGAAGPPHRADGNLSDWGGTASGFAGRTVVSRGELIHTDWVYDDYGPDLDGVPNPPRFRGAGTPTRGDFRYPEDPDRLGHNAADLRELRIAADRRRVHVLIALQTLQVPDAAIATVAFDGDGQETGSPSAWPDGAGVETPGPEAFLTTWGTGARLTTPAGTFDLPAGVDLDENAIEVSVPRRWLALGEDARVWAIAGVHAGDGRYLERQRGATAAFNAAFRDEPVAPREDTSAWSEDAQAAALARRDVSAFSHPLPLRRLERGASDPPAPLEPGLHVRILRSGTDFGEGIDADRGGEGQCTGTVAGEPAPQMRSRHQPYALYVPRGYDPARPAPLTLVGHSIEVNHLEYALFTPNLLRQLGDERGSLLVTPLARGMDTFYLDAGLVDVLEAWEDARHAASVDDERTYATGYSMGGYMTYRLGLLMPDRFARLSSYVGPPAFCHWAPPAPPRSLPGWEVAGNTNLVVENARNLPVELVHGNLDELVPVESAQRQADALAAAGAPYRFFRHIADDHLSFAAVDEWGRTRDWLGAHRRPRAPVEVVFRRYPAMDLAHRRVTLLGRPGPLVFDSAYWVRDVRVRDAGDPAASGRVEALTFGRGGQRPQPRPLAPAAVPGPATPGTLTGQERVPGERLPRRNAFEARLENVAAAGFELRAMGLSPGRPLRVRVVSDGPATLVLRGRFARGVAARAGRRRLAARRGRGQLAVRVPAGELSVVVARRR